MTYFRRDSWIQDVQGNALAGAELWVCYQGGARPVQVFRNRPPEPLAQIFRDAQGMELEAMQPLNANGTGHFFYYAATGFYTEVYFFQGRLFRVLPDQAIGILGGTIGGGFSTAALTSENVFGQPQPGQLVMIQTFVFQASFPANFSNPASYATAGAGATNPAVYVVELNGVNVGTVTFPATTVTGVTVLISPQGTTVTAGGTRQFSYTLTGSSNQAVTWSVLNNAGTGPGLGTISSTGLYTAPVSVPVQSFDQVTVTSVAEPTVSDVASVTINPVTGVTVLISPQGTTVTAGGIQQFTYILTGSTNQAVTWSVLNNAGTGPGLGTISATGLYTAPQASVPVQSFDQVIVTSVAEPTASDVASVTINPATGTGSVLPATARTGGALFQTAGFSVQPGDRVTIEAPDPMDATLSDVAISLAYTRLT